MKTMNAHKKLGSLLSKAGTNLSLILALLVMSVLFAIMSPHFLTLRNLVNIATYTSINAIMAFGITVAMILAAMDLSQYTVAAVSGMVMALMLRAGLPTGVAIVCAADGRSARPAQWRSGFDLRRQPDHRHARHAADLPRLCLSGLQRQEHSHQQ